MGEVITVTVQFEYGDLELRSVNRCESAVKKIDTHVRKSAQSIVAVGKELQAVKEHLPHGTFGPWLKHYFGWSAATAKRMMAAAETFKTLNLSDLIIDQSALYLLSSDKCDDDTREEIIERAESGERITHKMVKDALAADNEDVPVVEDDTEWHDEDAPEEWSAGAFVMAMHKEVQRWKRLCPAEEREELIRVIREIAEQLEANNEV